MEENAIFPKIEDVGNLANGAKQLVKNANVVDILSTYASNCSKQIHDFCIDNAIRKKMKDIDILSSLPAPIEMNLTNESPSLKLNKSYPIDNKNSEASPQSSLLTSYPIISIAHNWSQTSFLAGSLNYAFYFTLESFYGQQTRNENVDPNENEEFASNQLSTTIYPPGYRMSFCRSVSFHPSGALCAISKDNSVYLYDISPHSIENTNNDMNEANIIARKPILKHISSLLNIHQSCTTGMAFSPDGSHLVTASLDSSVKTHDLIRSQTIYNINIKKQATYLDSSLDGRFLGITTDTGNLILFDDRQEGSITSLSAHKYWASTLSFNSNSQLIATAGSDKSIALFDIRQPLSTVFRLYRHTGTPISICFDNSDRIWSSTTAGELQAWNLANARKVYNANLSKPEYSEDSQANTIFKILFVEPVNSLIYSIGHGEMKLMQINDEIFLNDNQSFKFD